MVEDDEENDTSFYQIGFQTADILMLNAVKIQLFYLRLESPIWLNE